MIRIDPQKIEKSEMTPLVETVLSFGVKQNRNEVLLDFIRNHLIKESNPEESNIFVQLLNEKSLHRRKIKHH